MALWPTAKQLEQLNINKQQTYPQSFENCSVVIQFNSNFPVPVPPSHSDPGCLPSTSPGNSHQRLHTKLRLKSLMSSWAILDLLPSHPTHWQVQHALQWPMGIREPWGPGRSWPRNNTIHDDGFDWYWKFLIWRKYWAPFLRLPPRDLKQRHHHHGHPHHHHDKSSWHFALPFLLRHNTYTRRGSFLAK